MKWGRIKNKKPPEGEDVLVCFNENNSYCCDVLSYDHDIHGEQEWWRIDATYQVKPNDWWAEIELPRSKP